MADPFKRYEDAKVAWEAKRWSAKPGSEGYFALRELDAATKAKNTYSQQLASASQSTLSIAQSTNRAAASRDVEAGAENAQLAASGVVRKTVAGTSGTEAQRRRKAALTGSSIRI